MRVDQGRKVLLAVSGILILFVLLGGVLGRSLAVEGTYPFLKLFNEVLYLVRNNYVDPVKDDALMEGAYRGMLESLDPMSEYLTADEVRRASRDERNGPADVGLMLSKRRGYAVIIVAGEGSPAAKSSLETGDLILTIDGKSTFRMGAWEATQALQGKVGSTVRLSVLRENGLKSEEVTLTRAIPVRTAPLVSLPEPGVGLLRLSSLQVGDAERVRKALASLHSRGAGRLMLDLRSCASASYEEAAKIAGLFIGGGTVLKLADRKTGPTELRASAGGPVWKGPLAAIVNGGTAGAAEGLAAALRDRAGASLIGEKTWGLGTSQKVIPLPAGDGIRLSVGKWQSPAGKEWNGTGLTPDIVQRAGEGKEDLQIQKTLEILKKGSGNHQAA